MRGVKEQISLLHTIDKGLLQRIGLLLLLIAAKHLLRQGGYFLLFLGYFLRITCIFQVIKGKKSN